MPEHQDTAQLDDTGTRSAKAKPFQRIAWAILTLLMVAAFFGLFGRGPLSHSTVDIPSVLQVQYNRFARYQGSEDIHVHLRPDITGDNGTIALWISEPFGNSVQIQQISPQPVAVKDSGNGQVYVFSLFGKNTGLDAHFYYKPNSVGRMPLKLGIVGGKTVHFMQFVYP
jgi:hypothetical protein